MKQRIYTKQWMAQLDTDVCNRHTNADLTLHLNLAFRPINPANGAKSGTLNDYGSATGTPRKIIPWTNSAWHHWTHRLCSSAQHFWNGKFWLNNNFGLFAITDALGTYLPSVYCRLRIHHVPGMAHHTIDVVRLDPSENWFGSHSKLYDHRDTSWALKSRDSKGRPVMQRAHVHEIGHLLGLGHVDEGKAHCPMASNTNATACYGIADEDMHTVMGAGMSLNSLFATPWQRAIIQLTGKGMPLTSDWEASMRRILPQRVSSSATPRGCGFGSNA